MNYNSFVKSIENLESISFLIWKVNYYGKFPKRRILFIGFKFGIYKNWEMDILIKLNEQNLFLLIGFSSFKAGGPIVQ